MNIGSLKTALFRGGLLLKKYSPEIMLATGTVGVVVSTVMACKATLKIDEVNNEAKAKFDRINEAKAKYIDDPQPILDEAGQEMPQPYAMEDYQRDMSIASVQTGMAYLKLYGPSIALGAASIALILASHGVMTNRQAGLIAAYNVVDAGFKAYRKRVVEDLGPDKDHQYRFGLDEKTVVVAGVEENGDPAPWEEEKKVYSLPADTVVNKPSQYARFFDETCPGYQRDRQMNLAYLIQREKMANMKLQNQGHLFLNEVYEMFGFPHTKAGAIVGWIKDSEKGDGAVDFDLHNPHNEKARDFVNGYEPSFLMDFNVDGIIYDQI